LTGKKQSQAAAARDFRIDEARLVTKIFDFDLTKCNGSLERFAATAPALQLATSCGKAVV